ncbi:MAG: response regulator [Vicinamibacteria bacterium]|nr:response regulator [Vicinamibacteria bacterium]
MTEGKPRLGTTDDLRRRAEERARKDAAQKPEDPETSSPETTRQLLHDLRVHQIELEMQNEELRRAQVALEASRARYFDLYDLAPVGYVTLSEQGLLLEANLTAATLLGMARGDLVRQPLSRFVCREDQDVYYLYRKQLLETGAPQACELRLEKKDGARFWAQLEATTAHDADGSPMCRAVLSDITERKRVEADKARLEDRHRQIQKAESMGRMGAAIAHHFNNLLQAVIGNLELAARDMPRDTPSAARLTDAVHAACKAAEIIGLTLTYLGHTIAKQEPLDLSDACRRGLRLLQAAIPKDVILKVDLPSPGPVISANGDQVQQVLTNLVHNAWDAVGAAGVIHVIVKTVSSSDIAATHRFPVDWQPQDCAYACLEVADSGCGIANKDVEPLFDPFFSSKLLGRGLGLPVVLGIVRTHRGAVTVESELGRGSAFRFYMPVLPEKVRRRADQAAQVSEMQRGGTALLVEDDEIVRNVAAAMLVHLGFTVLEARDGVEALELFSQRRNEIRCVLCDLTMPRMDGWQTMAALRKLEPDLPVILTSGYSEAQVMAGDHGERPQAFLNKPYQLKRLSDALGHALATKKQAP